MEFIYSFWCRYSGYTKNAPVGIGNIFMCRRWCRNENNLKEAAVFVMMVYVVRDVVLAIGLWLVACFKGREIG
jgi:hypothetical protein